MGQSSSSSSKHSHEAAQAAAEEVPYAYTSYSVDKADNTPQVTVVTQHPSSRNVDSELQRLSKIPRFLPILKSSLGLSSEHDTDFDHLNPEPYASIFATVEEHVKACSIQVCADQQLLAQEVKRVDTSVQQCAAKHNAHISACQKLTEKISSIPDLIESLEACRARMAEMTHALNDINSQLPEDLVLESLRSFDAKELVEIQ